MIHLLLLLQVYPTMSTPLPVRSKLVVKYARSFLVARRSHFHRRTAANKYIEVVNADSWF